MKIAGYSQGERMEWSNKYNSFNSDKGLTYYQNYKSIMKWMNSTSNELPPPIECNLDIIAECNLDCYFCITQRYLKTHREEVGKMRQLPLDYMLKLVDFLSEWGVKGLCISGGGEPSLHKDLPQVIHHARSLWMDVALVTNATVIPKELAHAIQSCRWVALSVDAGSRETYEKIKGYDLFDKVIDNIKHLVELREQYIHKVDLCFKFLVLPENVQGIYEACKLAKGLGVQDFHARPVDFERSDISRHKKLAINIGEVEEEFARCHTLETNDFHVYTVTHKFDSGFHIKHDFEECLAAPLVIPILQDGNAYLCVDRKMEAEFKLGSCYPNPESILNWWGSDKHKELINSVNIDKCSRCTWSQYNSQISSVVIKDGMCLAFP